MPLDTVSDVRTWLDNEDLTYEEVEEALDKELEGSSRKTAVDLLETRLDELPEPEPEREDEAEPEETPEKRYRVIRPHLDREPGDYVHLDPADYDTQALLTGGQLEYEPEGE